MKSGPMILGVSAAIVLSTVTTEAQITKSSTDGDPCCAIVAIDVAKAVATARDKAGKTFQFSVRDAALLKTLRVGQSVSADFGTGKVTVNGAQPCCAILTGRVNPAEPVGAKGKTPAEPVNTVKEEVKPIEPCCNITAIDLARGIVTAQVTASRAGFKFKVQDAALLRMLKVGQKVFADFTTNKVRIHGSEPCCSIITQ